MFQIFAFSNDAYDALGDTVKNTLESDDDLLRSTLQNHIVEGIRPTELVPVGESSVTSLFGNELTFRKQGSQIRVGGNRIVSGDMLAYNGILHMIDGVLLATPIASVETVFELLSGPNAVATTNTFVSQLEDLGLDSILGGSDTYTVFAPTNDAFGTFITSLAARGITDFFSLAEWSLHRKDLIEFHIAQGSHTFGEFNGFNDVTMINGNQVTMRNAGLTTVWPTFAGAVTPTTFDVPAQNGFVHVTPNVLTPEFFSNTLLDLIRTPYTEFFDLLASASLDSDLSMSHYTVRTPIEVFDHHTRMFFSFPPYSSSYQPMQPFARSETH